jgi:hypothetical protein
LFAKVFLHGFCRARLDFAGKPIECFKCGHDSRTRIVEQKNRGFLSSNQVKGEACHAFMAWGERLSPNQSATSPPFLELSSQKNAVESREDTGEDRGLESAVFVRFWTWHSDCSRYQQQGAYFLMRGSP